jgi:hypothetical protein
VTKEELVWSKEYCWTHLILANDELNHVVKQTVSCECRDFGLTGKWSIQRCLMSPTITKMMNEPLQQYNMLLTCQDYQYSSPSKEHGDGPGYSFSCSAFCIEWCDQGGWNSERNVRLKRKSKHFNPPSNVCPQRWYSTGEEAMLPCDALASTTTNQPLIDTIMNKMYLQTLHQCPDSGFPVSTLMWFVSRSKMVRTSAVRSLLVRMLAALKIGWISE